MCCAGALKQSMPAAGMKLSTTWTPLKSPPPAVPTHAEKVQRPVVVDVLESRRVVSATIGPVTETMAPGAG